MESRYAIFATLDMPTTNICLTDMGTPTPSQLGLITAIYFIGTFCGSVPASIITDKLSVHTQLLKYQY
jgi:fucose permease